MKYLSLIASLLLLFPALSAIPGTTEINAPIAPPSEASNFPGMDDRFLGGGFRVNFENIGDWLNPSLLPTGRMKTNMVVRARIDPLHQSFRCISISPRVFELDQDMNMKAQVDALIAGGGAVTNSAFIPAADVAAMIAIPLSRLTNGLVVVHTFSRTGSTGVGGGDYIFNYASTETANLGTVFAHSGGTGRFIYIGPEPGNVDLYGADGGGSTDSRAAFISASAYCKAKGFRLFWPSKVYLHKTWTPDSGIVLQGSKGTTLKAYEYPPYPGGATSAQADLNVNSITLLSNTVLDMGGGFIDSRHRDFAVGTFKFSGVGSRGTTNVIIRNVQFADPWHSSIHLRYCTNFTVSGCDTYYGPGWIQVNQCVGGRFTNMRSLSQQLNEVSVNQHILDFQDNQGISCDNWLIQAPLGSSAGKSYVLSGFTIGGDDSDSFTRIFFEPMDPATDINAAAMLFDACHRTLFADSIIDGWNVGPAIPIEVAGCREMIIRNISIQGKRETATLATYGGAGIYVVDGGIFGLDSGPWIWNEGGWQWRSHSAGSGVLIQDCQISGFYIGVDIRASFSKLLNNRIIGNTSAGVKIGGDGTIGVAENGKINSVTHRYVGIVLEGNTIAYNGDDGIRLECFDKLVIRNNFIGNNDQNELGGAGIANFTTGKSVNATGTTTTTIVMNAATTENFYKGKSVYYNGEVSKIIYNSTISLTVSPAFSTIPSGTVYIVSGVQGDFLLSGNFLGDDQARTMTNAFSLDPSQAQTSTIVNQTTDAGSTTSVIVSTTTTMTVNQYANRLLYIPSTGETCKILSNTASSFTLSGTIAAPSAGVSIRVIRTPLYTLNSSYLDEINPGQRILLKGVQTGGVDLRVVVRHWDWKNPDEVYVEPVGTSSLASFSLVGWETTAVGAIVAGSGNLTFTYNGPANYNPSGSLQVGVVSVNVESQLDGPYWVGVDPGTGTYQWRRVMRAGGFDGATNQFFINEPFTQTFAATPFRISKFNGVLAATQSFAVKAANTPMRMFTGGIENDYTGVQNAGILSITAAPDVPYPRVTVDSATPTLPGRGNNFCIANTTGVTITAINGGWEGRTVNLYFLSGSAPTLDCTGTTLVASDGIDHTLTTGSIVRMNYTNGKWLCTFVIP